MVRGDIIGGLKVSLARGESLQRAMQSFYNAGYKKEDIENAARTLKQEGFQPVSAQTKPLIQQNPLQKKPLHPGYKAPIASQPNPALQAKHSPIQQSQQQVVSSYSPSKQSKIDVITILLIIVLVVLLGILAGVFLFKQELIDFLNRLFG